MNINGHFEVFGKTIPYYHKHDVKAIVMFFFEREMKQEVFDSKALMYHRCIIFFVSEGGQ